MMRSLILAYLTVLFTFNIVTVGRFFYVKKIGIWKIHETPLMTKMPVKVDIVGTIFYVSKLFHLFQTESLGIFCKGIEFFGFMKKSASVKVYLASFT